MSRPATSSRYTRRTAFIPSRPIGWVRYWAASIWTTTESLQYFQRVLINSGIIAELERMGIQEGDTVRILDFEFDFIH